MGRSGADFDLDSRPGWVGERESLGRNRCIARPQIQIQPVDRSILMPLDDVGRESQVLNRPRALLGPGPVAEKAYGYPPAVIGGSHRPRIADPRILQRVQRPGFIGRTFEATDVDPIALKCLTGFGALLGEPNRAPAAVSPRALPGAASLKGPTDTQRRAVGESVAMDASDGPAAVAGATAGAVTAAGITLGAATVASAANTSRGRCASAWLTGGSKGTSIQCAHAMNARLTNNRTKTAVRTLHILDQRHQTP